MNAKNILELCEKNNCIMFEPRSDMDAAVRGIILCADKLRTVYSLEALTSIFEKRDGMNHEDAIDWVTYNLDCPQAEGWPVIVSEE